LIISLALTAITKFLSYNIISGDSPRLAEAMQLLSSAITHCRFEASDPATDEVVLLRILKLMGSIIVGPGGEILGDESVCEMMETGLSICCQPMLSEVLRRSAEIEMVSICQVIFERLKHLEVEAGDEPGALDKDTKADMDSVKMHTSKMQTSSTGKKAEESKPGEETGSVASVEKPIDGPTGVAMQNGGGTIDLPATHDEEDEGEALSIKPYSLPSIQELLRVLVNMLDPHDKRHTDTMRITALRMLDVALEVAGPSIVNHPSLATLAKDTLCRYLFQLVRSDNMATLKDLLRVCGTLLATCRGVLRLQQELFLSYVVANVFPIGDIPLEPGIEPFLYEDVPQLPGLVKQSQSPSQVPSGGKPRPAPVKDRRKLGLEDSARTPDAREAMVESVSALVRIPSFMVELFVNYDCDVDRSDMCSDMVGLLSRNAFPDSAQWRATNVPTLSLDSLLSYVQLIADRLDDAPTTEGFPDPDALRRQCSRKNIIIKGASKFNENPKAGIAFLATQGVIQNPENPMDIAEFIKGTTRIDKKVLGEFISKKTNEDILKEFMKLLNFAGKRIDEAVRELLGTFRLPGESALIERIVEVFAAQYMADATPAEIADSTAAFVLVYATILLNTDQHNPNFKGQKRMEFEDFARNLRGVNDKENFDVDFLREIFDSIQKREIILPEEHNDNSAYDHAWKELLVKVDSTSDLASCNTNIFDADMFAATWKPIVATLSYVFMSTTDDVVFARVVTGFDQCAQIAGTHGLSDTLDRIVACLSHISTLALEVAPSTSLNTEVQHKESSIMVSETAVRFGRDDRAQLATVVLFRILNGNESAIRDGWEQVSLPPTEIIDGSKLTAADCANTTQSFCKFFATFLILLRSQIDRTSIYPATKPHSNY
jgi:brefeldin A-resistance guanine nucleotide exchange factor 1